MTFSQDNFLERGQGGQSQKPEDGIFSNNFGGLNKIASALNVPFEDSPDLLNIEVDVSGNLNKRKGTKIVNWDKSPGTVEGVSAIPFTTGLGYNFLAVKNNTTFSLMEVVNDTATTVISKTNVFPSDASGIRINYVSTSEVEPRLIVTTGVTPPIQLKFVEQQQVFTGAASTTVIIQNAARFANATAANVVFFKDRVRQAGISVSYNSTLQQLSVSGLPLFTGTFTFDIILVCWQWWAEAYYYLGDRFSATATRSNSPSQIDRVVAIPASIRDGASLTFDRPGFYPITAYRSSAFSSRYTENYASTPVDRAQYAFCDGVPYNGAGITTPSPLFITFGGNADTGTSCDSNGYPQATGTVSCPFVMPVVFTRKRTVNFNGGRGMNNSSCFVYVDGNLVPLSTNTAAPVGTGQGSSWYSIASGGYFVISTTNTNMLGVEFSSSSQVGLPSSSVVEIVNPIPQDLGSGASNKRGDKGLDINVDGSWVPAYGFGDFADYGAGSYPTNVAIYQGRLVFSGFLNNSLRVLFSNQYDSVVPGMYFAHYQIDSVSTAATDAFDLTLSSSPDDVTKALIEWQQSLFVMTRKAVFRLYGGSNTSINGSNRLVVLVSSIGLINSYSVCRTDKSILYLSDTGVYDLSTSIDSTEYVAGDKSIKIRPLFGAASNPTYEARSWMSFDNTHKIVYLAYPEINIPNTAYRLYVYNTFRESWTEYYTPGGFNSYHGLSYVDRSTGSQFGMFVNTYRNTTTNVALDLVFIRTNHSRYIDFAQVVIGSGVAQKIVVPPVQRVITTSIDKVRFYSYERKDSGYAYGFRTLPMTDIPDVSVYVETGVGTNIYNGLVFGVDFKKTPEGKIYILENLGTGRKILIDTVMPVTQTDYGKQLYINASNPNFIFPYIVFIDNVLLPNQNNNHFLSITNPAFGGTGTDIQVTASTGAVIETGQAYPTYYHSPVFTKERLSMMKKGKYIYALFDNADGLNTYNPSDVNTTSGQLSNELVGRVKQRLNANISMKYEEDDFSETYYDNYGYNDLMWDDALFDIDEPTVNYKKSVMFKEALLGVGYSYQMVVWNYDEATFTLAGYQILAKSSGSRYINWSK